MAERDQNEGSGQQPPIGKQNDDQISGQAGQQPQGQQQGQQPLDQQGNFGTQEPGLRNQSDQELGSSGGQSATGQAQGGDTSTLSQDDKVGEGGYSPESGGSDLGGGETGLGDSGGQSNQGGFVGSQGQDSGEYLQQNGNPESGFAEQGRGVSNEDDENDIEGSSGNN